MFKGYIYRNREVSGFDKDDFKGFNNPGMKFWLDYEGGISLEQMKKFRDFIKLHPVTIEDLKGKEEKTRIKYESFDYYTFVVYTGIKKIAKDEIETYTIYFLVGKNFIITVHDEKNDIIERLKNSRKKLELLLSKGVDYVFHHIIDQEVDLFYPIVESLEKDIDEADNKILKEHEKKELDVLFDKKIINNELMSIVAPTGHMILRIIKPDNDFITEGSMIYFRDVYDNLVKINKSLRSSKDQMSAIITEHNAMSSSNLNQIMKVLTIIATIMMPLTLITGIYGMNVPVLPGGQSRESFYIIVGLMIIISIVMLLYFKKKDWI